MSTITLPNIRVSSDLTVGVVLKDGGVAIDWSTLSNIKAYLYADAQRAMAGRCSVAVDEEDSTRLVCSYRANKPQYIGVNRIVITCTYRGETKTFDKPALNFVRWTDDQAGQQITIDDPDVDVEIEVEDVSSSILEQAIAAALQAAADAEHAAHLIPNQVLLDCEQATAGANAAAEAANAAGITSVQVSVEDNEPGTPSAECTLVNKVLSIIFHYLKGETGDAAGFGAITATVDDVVGDPSVTVTASGPDTAKVLAFAFHGLRGIQGVPGVANAKYKQVDSLPTASADTMDFIYLTPSGTTGVYNMSYTEQDGSTYSWQDLGTTAIQLSDYATKAEVSQLEAKVTELTGGTITEAKNPGTSSSLWKDNNGVIGYQASGMGLHRADAIPISPGTQIDLTTTLGSTTANAGYVCDANDNILQTIARVSNTTTASFVAPANSAKFYLNYLSTYSFQKSGELEKKQDKLTFDSVPAEGSTNPVESGGIFNAIKNAKDDSTDYSSSEMTGSSRWINNNGTIGYSATGYSSRVDAIPVKEGEIIKFRTTVYNSTSPVGFFADNDGRVIYSIPFDVTFGILTTPPGATKLHLNYYNNFNTPFRCVSLGTIPEKTEQYLEYGIGPNGVIPLDDSMFVQRGIASVNGRPYATSTVISTLDAIRICPGVDIEYKTINSYRVGFAFYREDGTHIRNNEYFSGTGKIGTPESAWYVIVYITNPSGGSGTPSLSLSGLELSVDKTPLPGRSQKNRVPMFAPSPQLPANGNGDSDFNAETMTPSELYSKFADLLASATAPNSGLYNNPKPITIYENPGKDETNEFDINAYVITRRNRFGWLSVMPLYAWKNGNTVVYTDSISPMVGDAVYSDTSRTNTGTVGAYSVTNGITVGGVIYSYSVGDNYSGDYVYTAETSSASGASGQRGVYDKDGKTYLGAGTVSGNTLTYQSKAYTRMESLDFHTDKKATIVLWGNEHGPQSDPAECAVILYRMAKDLVGGCRNHPFLSFIKNYCKVVIVPCLNPYGLQNHKRNNGNNVNINRNYSTPGWSEQPDTDKGSYPGDQSETQFIMNLVSSMKADVAIDMHCLSYVTLTNQGRTHYAGRIPSISDKDNVVSVMASIGFYCSSYGDGNYNASGEGDSWLNYVGVSGGLIEMNAGPYASEYNGKQHSAVEMEANYTLVLQTLWMWYRGFDKTFDISGIYE